MRNRQGRRQKHTRATGVAFDSLAIWRQSVLLAVFLGFSALIATCALASESGGCDNEPTRQASLEDPATHAPYSTQLPDCRAYELVSPGENRGPVAGAPLYELLRPLSSEVAWGLMEQGGNLFGALAAPLNVQSGPEEPHVFWESIATPPGTGAIADGLSEDAFRSVRTATGWSTRDVLPYAFPSADRGGPEVKAIVGASTDGSATLIASNAVLTPNEVVNPRALYNAQAHEWFLYRVPADGSEPQLVTHSEYLTPGGAFYYALSASPDLQEVAFVSEVPLEEDDHCNHRHPVANSERQPESTTYLWNASEDIARTIVALPAGCLAPNIKEVPSILPDGRPVIYPSTEHWEDGSNPTLVPGGNPLGPQKYTFGPLVVNNRNVNQVGALTPLAGPGGGAWLADSPDGKIAYVASSEALPTQTPMPTNIYAVSTRRPPAGQEGKLEVLSCVSCGSDQAEVTFAGMSRDGSHLLFTTKKGLWNWSAQSGEAALLTEATGFSQVVPSQNGAYVVAVTGSGSQELAAGLSPVPIVGCGSPIMGVSDDGQRVVCDNTSKGLGVIDEWDAGQISQISPLGSPNSYPLGSPKSYAAQKVTGGELQDVFFLANEPLVPSDGNTLNTDVYDARIDGSFPPCTPGNPLPPAGTASCLPGSTPNPTSPPSLQYTTNFAIPGSELTPLMPDTAQPVAIPRSLTRLQKLLSKALRECRRMHSKRKREHCEAQARRKYATRRRVKAGNSERRR